MKIDFKIKSHKGQKSRINQDAYLIKAIPYKRSKLEYQIDLDDRSLLICIGDGIGGGSCGEVASAILCETSKKYFTLNNNLKNSKIELLELILFKTHEEILNYSNIHRIDFIGTTAVLSVFEGNKFYLSWIGDSRAYLLRNKKLMMLSWDHTNLWKRLKNGEINSEYAWEKRHYATMSQSLGDELTQIKPDFVEFEFKKNDVFLICTDGLTTEVKEKEIESILCADIDIESRMDLLIKQSVSNGSCDDITIFLGEIT